MVKRNCGNVEIKVRFLIEAHFFNLNYVLNVTVASWLPNPIVGVRIPQGVQIAGIV